MDYLEVWRFVYATFKNEYVIDLLPLAGGGI